MRSMKGTKKSTSTVSTRHTFSSTMRYELYDTPLGSGHSPSNRALLRSFTPT